MAIQHYKTKDGIRYRASFVINNKRETLGGFLSREQAQEWILDEKKKLREDPLALSHSVNSYLEELKSLDYAKGTIQFKYKIYSDFLKFCGGDIPLNELNPALIKRYVSQLKENTSSKTANRYLRELKTLFRWSEVNPTHKIRKFPEDKFKKYVPSESDMEKVIAAATGEELDLILIYYYTAARLGEIFNLRWKDVDLGNNRISLSSKKGVRDTISRPIELPKEGMDIILKRVPEGGTSPEDFVFINPRSGGPYDKNQHVIKYLLERLCKRAGVPRFTMHSIRHFIATKLIKSKRTNLKSLQLFLGHTRLDTTGRYAESILGATEIKGILDRGSHTGSHTEISEGRT